MKEKKQSKEKIEKPRGNRSNAVSWRKLKHSVIDIKIIIKRIREEIVSMKWEQGVIKKKEPFEE